MSARRPVIVWLQAIAWSLAAVAAPNGFDQAEQAIERAIERNRVPSIAWAVVRDGNVVWSGGHGLAQIDEQVAATADTPYILASVSKPITATGLMILVDEGQVSLDEPVNTYLRKAEVRAYVGDPNSMTVRRLANHTSGMPTHWNFFYAPNEPPPMSDTMNRYAFAAWEPGTRTNYSNLAFGILNHITATVADQPWGAYMEARVYDPVGMAHTSDRIRPGLESVAAHSYTRDVADRWVRVTRYGFDHPGASAIWSSAHDLARFLRLHMNGGAVDGVRILSEEAADTMQRVHPDAERAGSNYGVSWELRQERGHKQFAHTGGMPGVLTALVGYPDLNSGYALLTNGDSHHEIGRIEREIKKVILPEVEREKSTEASSEKTTSDVPTGNWEGHIIEGSSRVPMRIEFVDEERAKVGLGADGNLRKRIDYRQNGDRISFDFEGKFGRHAHYHGVPTLQFALSLESGVIRGVLYVDAPQYFHLPHYVELIPAAD